MKLLLDTHVLLWAVLEPDRLSAPARDAIELRSNDLIASAASAWEIATKHRLGRLPIATALLADYDGVLARLGVREAPVTSRVAIVAGQLDWPHRDPFDRMMAAHALLGMLPLVTADAALAGAPGISVLW